MSQPNGISIRFTLLTMALGLLAFAVPLFFFINNWGPRTDEHQFPLDMDAFVLKWDADDDNALNVKELRQLAGHRLETCRLLGQQHAADNSLVAGSSPAGSTTQSCANPEFPVSAEHPRFSAVWGV
jgi:hypothetical protein